MPVRSLFALTLLGVLLAAAPAAARTYVADPYTQKLKVKPYKLSFRDVEFTELRWKRWSQGITTARGISRILTCSPSCGEGGAETTATTVTLSRIRERGGKRRYTCMSWKDDERVTDLPDHGSLNPSTLRPCKAPAGTARAAARCRGIDLGFTTATVTTSRVSCRQGRFVLLEWKRKANESGNGPPPTIIHALGYRCRFGGTEGLVKTRCTRGRRVVKMTWGD